MEFVQFETSDSLRLHGIYADAGADVTVIHIHGKGGNFYENAFVREMLQSYPRLGVNVLSFNNRGHAQYAEAHQRGRVVYIGTAVERFEDCLVDLGAAVAYVESRGARPVLQGHSYGCEKAMYYGLQIDPAVPLILLSPSDGYRLQNAFIEPEIVEEQLARLRASYSLTYDEWLPASEYGIRCPSVEYHVPITARALVELMEGPAFSLLRLDKASWPAVENPALVYVGGRDALQLDGSGAMIELIESRFLRGEVLQFAEGNHHLRPVIDEVIEAAAEWSKSTLS